MADIHANSLNANSPAVVGVPAVTEEVFLDDRKKFWSFFTGLITTAIIVVAVILIGLAVFLV